MSAQVHEGRRIPQVGERYRSRDARDNGLTVTVIDYANGFVRIQRFRKTTVSLRRFYRDYELVPES